MSIPTEIREAREQERRLCVGIVLHEYALWKSAGYDHVSQVLDALATKLEYPDLPHPTERALNRL